MLRRQSGDLMAGIDLQVSHSAARDNRIASPQNATDDETKPAMILAASEPLARR